MHIAIGYKVAFILYQFRQKGVLVMLDTVRKIIRDSNNIVIISGMKLMEESGLADIKNQENCFEIERKYGYSPEEILTTGFLNKRADQFYSYLKEYVLDFEHMYPTQAHYAIAKLEQQGKLSAVITRTIMGIHQMAGIHNVIELYGNIQENYCPRCYKRYTAKDISEEKGVPHCNICRLPIKLGIALYGERLDNGKMSQSIEKVLHADVLILAGTSTTSYLSRWLLDYYEGNKMILINNKRELEDNRANYTLYGSCQDILPKII